MGRWQPYLYEPAERQSFHDVPKPFNPKSVTMASHRPQPPKKKQDGPLVNFNRHPDSYLVLPYGRTDAKPMSPKTKVILKYTRWVQLFFRVATLFGAIGVLLCAIFIRGAPNTEGYIIRIPPGVDLVNTLYAIYHLLRAAKARPAASSASYHLFALVMDAGFIPFYIFTALLSNRNFNEEAGTSGRWRTFFPTDEETNKVLQTTWLTAVTVAGFHCASLCLDLYLALVFRKISRLPPDMNPLEDNLTSRRNTKHKHKNSSISAMTPLTAEEKRMSAQSVGGTTVVGSRTSQADPLLFEKGIPAPEENQIKFMHTRTDSGMTYSPHNPNSARHSRVIYSQPNSARQSRADLNTRDDLLRRDDGNEIETLAQRKSFLSQQANIKRHSRPNSMVSSKQEYYTPPSTAGKHSSTGDISLQNSRESLQSDNWFVHDNSSDEPPEPPAHNVSRKSMFTSKNQAQGYNTISTSEDMYEDQYDAPMVPQPLRMNPPTPPLGNERAKATPPPPALKRTYTVTSMSSEATFSRTPTSASSKSRYYGDLKAATQGIRNGGNSPAQSPGASPTKGFFAPNSLPSATKQYTTNSPVTTGNNYTSNSPFSLDKNKFSSVRRTGETGHTPVKAESPRVVSRSGVDYFDDDMSDLGTAGRRRDVSGKIAEEGRGGGCGPAASRWGMRANELTYRKVSGVA
ncbi:hypothetical protein K491DRAFT_651026 [Lophiostoma macrostomum CBS 122681]|uniref:Uncharacterized protein n=1 Tax=Lophiostoma macrostomum CBS 122681 TaxID=1314788 RepID=A0A6A6TJH7_9PLEO|nr:hypothetical protein K491DRAFT_651026 [Lophiostoma macrostomum CBS 122681]